MRVGGVSPMEAPPQDLEIDKVAVRTQEPRSEMESPMLTPESNPSHPIECLEGGPRYHEPSSRVQKPLSTL